MQLEGLNAVVTGGGTGIGLAISRELKAAGVNVTICGRRADVLEPVADGNGFDWAVLDITDAKAVAAFAMERDDIDIVVNNAGIMHMRSVADRDAVDVAAREFDTNVIGPIRLIHALLPTLQARSGAIVNITSGLAYVPWPAAPSYCATKAALHSWTQSLRFQLDGVDVFEVLPPLTETTMTTEVDIGMRKVTPEEVAEATVEGLRKDRYEIPVGMSKSLATMRRIAPGFIGKQLAKAS